MTAESTLQVLEQVKARLESVQGFDAASLENLLRPMAEELKVKTGQLFGTIRTAVSGRTATPPLFQMMEVLGRERTMQRISAAMEKL